MGDPARDIPPFYENKPGVEHSGLFLFLNTSKRSVTLDLKSPVGREAVKRLASKTDVLVENFNPRVMPSLGLDYATLSALSPKLVMTSISNFGQTGPYRDWKGTDITFLRHGRRDDHHGPSGAGAAEPVGSRPDIPYWRDRGGGDVDRARWGRGLRRRRPPGRERVRNVDGGDRPPDGLPDEHQYTGDVSSRPWPASALGSGVFGCADGHFMITAGAAMFPRLAQMVGAGGLLEQPEWSTVAERSKPERIDEFAAVLIPWLFERTKAEIRDECQEYGVLGGPVNTFEDVLGDRHLNARGFFHEIDHPTTGPAVYPGYSLKLHVDGGMPPRRRAPLLGEHTQEVLGRRVGDDGPRDRRGAVRSRSAMSSISLSGRKLPLEGVRILDIAVVWAGPYATQLLAEWARRSSVSNRSSTSRPPRGSGGQTDESDGGDGRRDGRHPEPRAGRTAVEPGSVVQPPRPEQEGDDRRPHEARRPGGLGPADRNLGRADREQCAREHGAHRCDVGAGVEGEPEVRPVADAGVRAGWAIQELPDVRSHMAASVGPLHDDGIPGRGRVGDGQHAGRGRRRGAGGALAFASGLRYARKNGKGIFIEIASAENFATYLGDFMLDFTMNGALPEHEGNRHRVLAPQGTYACYGEDRWLTISVESDEEWRALCGAMGRDDLSRDPRFATRDGRRENHDVLDEQITAWTVEQDAQEAMHALQEAGVAAGVVMNDADAFADPHLRERGFWEPLEHPEIEGGPRLHTGSLWKAELRPRKHRRPRPAWARTTSTCTRNCWASRPRSTSGSNRTATSGWTTRRTCSRSSRGGRK